MPNYQIYFGHYHFKFQQAFKENIMKNTYIREVKEVKEVREVKAICFTDRYSTQKAVGYNF